MAKKAAKKVVAAKPQPAAEPMDEDFERPVPWDKPLERAAVQYTGSDEAEAKVMTLTSKDTPRRRQIILETLSSGLSYAAAANAAGVSRRLILMWKDKDPEFKKACTEAHQVGIDFMEDEALRRAVQGTDRPVFQQGMLVGHYKEYSDSLLIMQLKGRRPERWRENANEDKDKPITLYVDDVDAKA